MSREYKLEHKGSITHVIDDKRPKGITVRLVLAWIFSVLFLLSGIGNMFNTSVMGGLLILLAGLILFPPLDAAIRNKWNFYLSSWLKFFVVLILLSIATPIIIAEGFSKTSSQNGNQDVANIAPKQQSLLFYTEEDVKNVIAEAKGMANKPDQKLAFWNIYKYSKGDNAFIVFTPYGMAITSLVEKIEKYDTYTEEDVRLLLNSNYVYSQAIDLVTSQAYSKWNTDDLRAVIEYDSGGKVCKGEIIDANSEYSDLDSNYNPLYKTYISATFDCYSDVRNKIVTFVYVLGYKKFRLEDVNMSKLK